MVNNKSLGYVGSQGISELLLNSWYTGWDWFTVERTLNKQKPVEALESRGEEFGRCLTARAQSVSLSWEAI